MKNGFDEARAEAIVAAHERLDGPLLPTLLAIQAEFGWVSDAAAAYVAERLNVSRADAHGVLTFYHDLRRAPPPRHVVKLCRAEACQARGARAAQAALEAALGVALGEARADAAVALEVAYCLGLCASGPAAMLDGRPRAALAGARLQSLIDEATA